MNRRLVLEVVVEYPYPKPVSCDRDQLLQEVWDNVNKWPQTIRHDAAQVVFGFKSALSTADQSLLSQTVSNHVADPLWKEKREPWRDWIGQTIVWAVIDNFDIPNKKVTVKKTIGGQVFTKECAVSWSIKHAYLAGDLAAGDKVLLAFVDGDINKPIVLDSIIL